MVQDMVSQMCVVEMCGVVRHNRSSYSGRMSFDRSSLGGYSGRMKVCTCG